MVEKSEVAVAKCQYYSLNDVQSAVKTCMDALGGLQSYINPGDTVLLKPNLLQAKPPEEYITTHPVLVEAVINLVRDAGGIPQVGDSPGAFDRGLEKYWNITGLTEVCGRLDVELVNFETAGSYLKSRNGRDYHIAKPVLDADLVINLPKIKTHSSPPSRVQLKTFTARYQDSPRWNTINRPHNHPSSLKWWWISLQ